jgi:Nucleoporin Nup188, N-terminal/Nucleoporin Nup188, N-terminal subdomain III
MFSKKRLLEVLERGELDEREVEEELIKCEDVLLAPLSWPHRNEASREQLTGRSNLIWRERAYRPSVAWQKLVLELSVLLDLDELESFYLLRNFLHYELKGAEQNFELKQRRHRDNLLADLFDYFYDEQLCTLHTLAALLRIADDDAERYHDTAAQCVTRLIRRALPVHLRSLVFPSTRLNSSSSGASSSSSASSSNVAGDERNSVAVSAVAGELAAPKHLKRRYCERWAKHRVEQQEAVLKVLFLLYYRRLQCDDRRLDDFAHAFHAHSFGVRQKIIPLLDEGGRETIARISHMCVLILLECLNLDRYSPQPRRRGANGDDDDECASTPNRPIKSHTVLNLTKFFLQWGDLPQHGPVLLAWAALLEQFQALDEQGSEVDSGVGLPPHERVDELEESKQLFGQRALALDAVGYLHSMLAGDFFDSEPNMIGFKSVVYGMLTTSCCAFPRLVYSQPRMVDLYAEVFRQNPVSTSMFLALDRFDAQRGHFFVATLRLFPLRVVLLARLLTALANDPESATDVYELLSSVSTFAAPHTATVEGSIERVQSSATSIVTVRQCAVPISALYDQSEASITLPAGTRGALMPGTNSVLFHVEYPIAQIFLALIDAFLERARVGRVAPQHLEQVTALFALITRLVSQPGERGQQLAYRVRQNLRSLVVAHKSTPLLPRLLKALQRVVAMHVRRGAADAAADDDADARTTETLGACAHCLQAIANHDPVSVWHHMRRFSVLEGFGQRARAAGDLSSLSADGIGGSSGGGAGAGVGGLKLSSPLTTAGSIRHVLAFIEAPNGRYPISLSFLNLLHTLLIFVKQWRLKDDPAATDDDDDVGNDTFAPNATYIGDGEHAAAAAAASGARSSSSHWTEWKESVDSSAFGAALAYVRTDIVNCFGRGRFARIEERWLLGTGFLRIFNVVLSDPSDRALRNDLLSNIAYDSSFHHTLLSIVSIGPRMLERWRVRRSLQAASLEVLVEQALGLLERLLFVTGDERSAPLQQALLSRTLGKDSRPLVLVLAQYINYVYNDAIPLSATRVLTQLASNAGRPASLLGFFGDEEQHLRSVFLHRLARRRESPALRVAILDFITASLQFQPGLANLFINFDAAKKSKRKEEAGDESASSGGGSTGEAASSTTPQSKQHCLDIVLSLLAPKYGFLERHSNLYAAALAMLHALWEVAPQHRATVRHLRDNSEFWERLVTPLVQQIDSRRRRQRSVVDDDDGNDGDDETSIPSGPTAVAECHRVASRAWVLRILTLEILYAGERDEIAAPVRAKLDQIKDSQVLWMEHFCRLHYRTDVKRRLERHARRLGVPIERALSDGLRRTFGRRYVYDIALIRRNLQQSAGDPRVRKLHALLDEANMMLSLADAELALLHAWRRFVEVSAQRGAVSYLPSTVPGAGDPALALIKGLADRLASEKREAYLVVKKMRDMSLLLVSLVEMRVSASSARGGGGALFPTEFVVGSLTPTIRRICAYLQDASTSERHEGLLTTQASLLASTLALLRAAEPSERLAAHCLELLPHLCECAQHPRLLNVGMAALQQVVARHLAAYVAPSSYMAHFRRDNFLSRLLERVGAWMQRAERPSTTLVATHLLLALAQHPGTAEALAVGRLVMLLCTESLPVFAASVPPYSVDTDRRNTWHRVWCTFLAIVCSMARELGFSESFVDQALQFIVTHYARLQRALQMPDIVTMASLDELERATQLFYELGHFQKRWRYLLGALAADHQRNVLGLVHRCVLLLVDPTEFGFKLRAITKAERLGNLATRGGTGKQGAPSTPKTPSKSKRSKKKTKKTKNGRKRATSGSDGRFSSSASASASSSSAMGGWSDMPNVKSEFFRNAERALGRVLLNSLNYVRLMSPNPLWYVSGSHALSRLNDPDSVHALFSPLTDTVAVAGPLPPLGVLTSAIDWCAMRLRQLERDEDNDDENGGGDQAKNAEVRADIALIAAIAENTMFIALGHAAYFFHEYRSDRVSLQPSVARSMITALESVIKTLKRRSECEELASAGLQLLAEVISADAAPTSASFASSSSSVASVASSVASPRSGASPSRLAMPFLLTPQHSRAFLS